MWVVHSPKKVIKFNKFNQFNNSLNEVNSSKTNMNDYLFAL